MLRKLIAAMILISGLAYGQSTTGWSIVSTEGTNLYQDGTVLAAGITNYFKPAFGSLVADLDPFEVADSVYVTNGTIDSGTVTNTHVEDGSYLLIGENAAQAFEVYFYFTNSTECPRLVTFHGRYEGNAPHNIKFAGWDYTNSVYTNLTADADDLPSSTSDSTKQFNFPSPQENFCDANGESRVRILHDGSGVSSHELYVDFIQLVYATATATNAGVWYPLSGFPVGQSNNTIPSASASTIETVDAGEYEHYWALAFTGQTNSEFHVRHVTNSTATATESIRTIGSTPQVGSMSAFGGGYQPAGTTNSWEFKSTSDDAWISIISGTAKIKKEAN